MQTLNDVYAKDKFLHHAYLVEGGRETRAELVLFFKEALGIAAQGNPDVVVQEFSTLGIDDSRNLKEMASRKSAGGGKKLFVVMADFFTREAQNSLLKLFEEPTQDTHFFLVTDNVDTLLPTLKSRLMRVTAEGEGKQGFSKEVEDFLKMPARLRLESPLITTLVEEKDKQKAIVFLDALALELRDRAGRDIAPYKEVFGELLKGRNYLRDRSASVKLILEHLSLIVPTLR
ncbi:hypothetical protein KW797_02775 [Candidatus Parcubacteria bacterium]|nr:hypothetical protein [Candidatus Parcubacteria bacterium]